MDNRYCLICHSQDRVRCTVFPLLTPPWYRQKGYHSLFLIDSRQILVTYTKENGIILKQSSEKTDSNHTFLIRQSILEIKFKPNLFAQLMNYG